MADKEERIFVARLTQDPYTCDIGGICKGEKCLSEQCQWGMTRQEAIEIMAKGMYLLTNPEDTKYADFYNCYFFELAEAALNALLEGGKK